MSEERSEGDVTLRHELRTYLDAGWVMDPFQPWSLIDPDDRRKVIYYHPHRGTLAYSPECIPFMVDGIVRKSAPGGERQ